MYVIIICATLPTLRQFYLYAMGRSCHNSSYGNSWSGGPGGSHQQDKSHSVGLSSLRSRLAPGRKTTATYQEAPSSQENVLPAKTQIHKVTEFHISRDAGKGDSHGAHDMSPEDVP